MTTATTSSENIFCEMREIGRALQWAEDGATWVPGVMGAAPRGEFDALLAAPEAT